MRSVALIKTGMNLHTAIDRLALAGGRDSKGLGFKVKLLGWVQQPQGWTFEPKQFPLIPFPEDSVLVIVAHPKHFTQPMRCVVLVGQEFLHNLLLHESGCGHELLPYAEDDHFDRHLVLVAHKAATS